MKVELVPLEILRPHEEILPKKVDQLEKMTHRWNAYTKPLLIDKSSGTILDGHHRWSGAYIGTGGGLTHSNVHIVQGNKDELLPALTAIGNAIGRAQKESVESQDRQIMERWNKLAGLLKD